MVEQTLTRLEFGRIVEQLANETLFEGSRRLAEMAAPKADIEEAKRLLKETDEAVALLARHDTSFISRASDIGGLIKKAVAFGMLLPEELARTWHTLKVMQSVSALSDDRCPTLSSKIAGMQSMAPLVQYLGSIVDEYGVIRDDASHELKSIRQRMTATRQRIKEFLRDFLRSADNQKMLQDAIVTERSGRYVVPVRQEYRYDIRGIIHDESASGATVYVEPERVVVMNNDLRRLEAEERREIERILREASARLAAASEEVLGNLAVLSDLDYILARGRLAMAMDAYCPDLNEEGIVELYRARHPLIPKERAVTIDVELGKAFDLLVITGPNTGGKTVTLKTVGLLTLMAMAGLFIPAREHSRVAVFGSVYVDIGDEQSIEQSLSTFSAHMSNIISILNQADSRSLVLLDELGSGTDPQEGAALGRAILEALLARDVRAVVTTHHSALKVFAYENERVQNACVEFDPVTLRPTYALTIGMPGQSNALAIASRLGLDRSIVERASGFVPQSEQEISNMLRQIRQTRQEASEEKEKARRLRQALEAEREALTREREAMRTQSEEALSRARMEGRRYVEAARREAESVIEELRGMLRQKEPPRWHEIQEVRGRLDRLAPPSRQADDERVSDQIAEGDYVEISSIGQRGYVLEGPDNEDAFVIQVGIMKVSAKRSDLIKRRSPEEKKARQRMSTFLEKTRNISPEIDLRGCLGDEAVEQIERYLEDAFLAGLERVRIIHGKGTGALRRVVSEYLGGHPYVAEYGQAPANEGGAGVTIARLKK